MYGVLRYACIVVVSQSERKRCVGRLRCRWEDILKCILRKYGVKVWTDFIWLRMGTGVMLHFHKRWRILLAS
jgi:hypothetical protein